MLNSHTHCQVAPADTQAKTWQRSVSVQPHDQNDQQTSERNRTPKR